MRYGSVNIPGVSSPDFRAHTENKNNPHSVTKSQVGLGNVDNTSDANKPISTAMQNALNGKANSSHTHAATNITQDASHRFVTDSEKTTWNRKANSSHTHAATSITQDSSHRFVTDSEKAIWNGKSNPNLLDNWYFLDPINQRGQTQYSGDWIFGIDRWRISKGTLQVLSDNSISFSSTTDVSSGEGNLFLHLPDVPAGTYCCSLLYKNSTGTPYVSFYNDYFNATAGTGLVSGIVTVPETTDCFFRVGVHKGTVYPIAAKLEKGSQQTLAHKENGVWVLNDPPPNKALELLKCQRYYLRTIANHYFPGSFYHEYRACLLVPTPIQMRTNPSVNILCSDRIDIGGTTLWEPFDIANTFAHSDAIGLKVFVDFASPQPALGATTFVDWAFEFSAEL